MAAQKSTSRAEMTTNGMNLPLEPIRVLDLTHRLAGPMLTMLLGDWGADVLKIEWWRRMDAWRGMISIEHDVGGEQRYNKGANWLKLNRNKRSLTLNLKSEKGKGLFLELVKKSDVVAENFSAGVMERLGLGYERLSALNPGIIMISMPGFGKSGPHASFVSNGATIEGYAGLASLTGYEDGVPRNSVAIWPDPVAGIQGAVAVGLALMRREETGKGQYIELAQAEALISMIGDSVLDYAVNGTVQSPVGNGDSTMAPHGVYPCGGDDRWISIAVGTDAEWNALCESAGHDEWAQDGRFQTQLSRWRHRAELDTAIGEWTASQDAWELADRLQAAGIPAAPVVNEEDFLQSEDLPSRGFHQVLDHPHLRRFPGPAARLDGEAPPIRYGPPNLGAHSDEVCRDLLGLSEDDLNQLREEGVI